MMNKKLLVVVPYRDRERHLSHFIPYLSSTLNQQNITNQIVVIEQSIHRPFNRGLVSNIGFDIFHNDFDYVCIHDVDMIGEDFDYSYELNCVIHLSFNRKVDNEYVAAYDRYLGGVVMFDKKDFLKINGFSNSYWGWGCEDDDLRLRCHTFNLNILYKKGHYSTLPHEKTVDKNLYQKNYNFMVEQFKYVNNERIDIIRNDGVKQCHKNYQAVETVKNQLYTLVKCDIK